MSDKMREAAIAAAYKHFPDVTEPSDHPLGKIVVDRGSIRYGFLEGVNFALAQAPPSRPVTAGATGDWPPSFELMKLQARNPDGGDWIDIFPAQLGWMAKEGKDVRAIEGPAVSPQDGQAADMIPVPKAALDWLFGEGKDEKGWGFGECREAQLAMNAKNPRRYWWRPKFRKMIPALAPKGAANG